jgi:hypothetical protein
MDSMGGILTKGLGAPACCGIILAQFNLAKCCQYTVTVTPPQYDGGSIPLAPGQIHNFYTPVGTGGESRNPLKPLEYLTPYNAPQRVEKLTITLTVKDGEPVIREYYVPVERSKVIITIMRFVLGTHGLISVTGTNLRNRLAARIKVIVDSLRKR